MKSAVRAVPVFTIGGIKDPAMAEEILAAGKADMVAMTRAQIADPELANKARERTSTTASAATRAAFFKGLPITCTVNPATGREARFGAGTLEPPPTRGTGSSSAAVPRVCEAAAILGKRGTA